MNSRCYRIRQHFAHRTCVGSRHRRDVKLQCAASKKGVHLHWYVLCLSFSRTSPSSRRVPGGGAALLQYLARITSRSSAPTSSTCKKDLPHIAISSRTELSPSSNSFRASMSPRNCSGHGGGEGGGRDALLVRLSVPISPRHCKEPSCQQILACFQREELILFEASILSRKVAQA